MTPAVIELEARGIRFEIISYEHDPAADSYGIEAAEALGVAADTVFKTLLAELDTGELVVGVVPVSGLLDLKQLAKAAGAKRATMADPAKAERTTGYVVGGISPLGQRKRLRTFVDEWATALEVMRVSGGKRGLELELAPDDLLGALDATVAPIAAD